MDSNLKISFNDDWNPKLLDIFSALFVFSLIITNILNAKVFEFHGFTFAAGILTFPLCMIFGDILTELYGFNRTRRIILTGFFCSLLFVVFTQIGIALPPAESWHLQNEFSAIYQQTPRIMIASFIAYLCGEFSNSYVISRMKIWSKGKGFSARAIASTLVGQGVDSLVFFPAAFWGILPNEVVINMVFSGWLFKVLYETAVVPLTATLVKRCKQYEGIEHFDRKF